jgi:hypothetical protein
MSNDRAARHKHSGWAIAPREDDDAKEVAARFAPEQADIEDAVEDAKPKRKPKAKLEVVE